MPSPSSARCRMVMLTQRSAQRARSASIGCSAQPATAAATSSWHSWSAASSIPGPSLPPPGRCRRRRRPPAWASSSLSGRWTKTSSIPHSIGWRYASRQSRRPLPNAISPAVRWCFTTCRRATWKAAAARSPNSATAVTANRANGKSSMACSAPRTVVRWQSRSSRATPQTRRP